MADTADKLSTVLDDAFSKFAEDWQKNETQFGDVFKIVSNSMTTLNQSITQQTQFLQSQKDNSSSKGGYTQSAPKATGESGNGILSQIGKLFSQSTKTALVGEDKSKLAGGDNWLETLKKNPSGGGGGEGGGGALGSIGGLAGIAGAIGAAVAGVVAGLGELVNKLQGFVAKISPGTIEVFQRAMDNVSATIGQSFIPLFEVLTSVLRQAAQIIAPAFEALTPVIQQLSEMIGNSLIQIIRIFADSLSAYVPLLADLGNVLQPLLEVVVILQQVTSIIVKAFVILLDILLKVLTPVLQAVTVILQAFSGVLRIVSEALTILSIVIQALFEAVGPGINFVRDAFVDLQKTIQSVIKSLFVFAVQLSKLLGSSVADSIVAYLDKKADAEGKTAAQQAQIKSFEALAKDISTKAAGAGAGGDGAIADERAFWGEVRDAAKLANKETTSFREVVEKKFDELINKIPGVSTVKEAASAAGEYLSVAEDSNFRKGLGVIGGWVGL